MACWLYQINARNYSQERYRAEVWEGSVTQNWTLGESPNKPKDISLGDLIIFLFVKAGRRDPGIYGWGIVTFFDKELEEIHFRPVPPSDYLKMNPVPEDKVHGIVGTIQGGFAQKAMFKIEDKEFRALRQEIAKHTYGISP